MDYEASTGGLGRPGDQLADGSPVLYGNWGARWGFRTSLRGSFPAWAAKFVYIFGSIVYRPARSQLSSAVAVYIFLPFVYTTDGVLYMETGKVYMPGSRERGTAVNVYIIRADVYRAGRALYTRAGKIYTQKPETNGRAVRSFGG